MCDELEKGAEVSDRSPTARAYRSIPEATETNHGNSVINYHDPVTFESAMSQNTILGRQQYISRTVQGSTA